FEPTPKDDERPLPIARVHGGLLALLALPTLALFLFWSPLQRLVDASMTQWAPVAPPISRR
ncbi:MAG TPA: hypothetical protein VIA18_04445, partial [Polyangia bacterium]|nr:hypothetical protein [Polyangia bacterium]